MTVIVLAVCPEGLRGHLTRWLVEISSGVYVGNVSARVRDLLWQRVLEMVGRGRALMVHSVAGEQRLSFRSHNHEWSPKDFDGITLMMRPSAERAAETNNMLKPGWSAAAKRRKYGRR